jgi:hypothetical protein
MKRTTMMTRLSLLTSVGALALLVSACNDNESTEPTQTTATSTSSDGGAGGAGGTSTTASGGAGGGTTTSSSGGAGGGTTSACLDASEYSAHFALQDAELCVVGNYTAAGLVLGFDAAMNHSREATWGAHQGPLTLSPGTNEVVIDRWKAPAGASGALTKETTTTPVTIPAAAFLGAQAIDLPFFDWTAISYQGAYPNTQGELILLRANAVDVRYDVNGLFGGASLAASSGGRLLYSGLSALDDAATSLNALYAADSCGTAGAGRRLLPEGDATCTAPSSVSAWGESSGPVAVDSAGNAFVLMANFSDGTQEARAFAASTVERGAPPSAGDALVTLPGFAMSLAALAPTGDKQGIAVFQRSDPATYEALDLQAQRYAVDGATVTPSKAPDGPTTLLHFTTTNTAAHLFTDDEGRLWVGLQDGTATRFYVLARKP